MAKAQIYRGANGLGASVQSINKVNEDQNAPAIEIPFDFPIQSIFNVAVAQYGILPQPKNAQIVQSTLEPKTIPCYAVAAPPDNECPVAIQFYANGARGKSGVLRLTPGQIVRPHGLQGDGSSGSAGGFDFGLPFGWLGGGRGRLIIFKTADSYLRYIAQAGGSELLFHQIALPIVAADGAVPPNWPRAFPWPHAESQVDASGTAQSAPRDQAGKPYLTVRATKTVYELVCNSGGAFGGAVVNVFVHRGGAAPAFQSSLNFPPTTGNFNSIIYQPANEIDQGAGDDAYIVFQNAALVAFSINVYRYGVLG